MAIAVADNATVVTVVVAAAPVPLPRSPGCPSLRRHRDSTATSLYRTPTIDVCSQFAQFLRPSSAPTRTGDAHSIYSTLVLPLSLLDPLSSSSVPARTPTLLFRMSPRRDRGYLRGGDGSDDDGDGGDDDVCDDEDDDDDGGAGGGGGGGGVGSGSDSLASRSGVSRTDLLLLLLLLPLPHCRGRSAEKRYSLRAYSAHSDDATITDDENDSD